MRENTLKYQSGQSTHFLAHVRVDIFEVLWETSNSNEHFLNMFYVPGTVLSSLRMVSRLTHTKSPLLFLFSK